MLTFYDFKQRQADPDKRLEPLEQEQVNDYEHEVERQVNRKKCEQPLRRVELWA